VLQKEVGKLIKETLDTKGIQVKEISDILALSQNTIYNVIYGKTHKKDIIKKITDHLNIPYKEILGEESINLYKLSISTKVVCEYFMDLEQEEADKRLLNELITEVYHSVICSDYNENEIRIYSKGLIDSYIKSNHITISKNYTSIKA
jgi:orotate phosphoribosyltransferase-like protein